MTKLKEIPMLFDAESVRGIMDDRKTQTRRTQGLEEVNKRPLAWQLAWQGIEEKSGKWCAQFDMMGCSAFCKAKAAPGMVIWCKETFRLLHDPATCLEGALAIDYRADGANRIADRLKGKKKLPWRPSIFMRRCWCRILLRCTAVRVERLQDISENDALAEGIKKCKEGDPWPTTQYKTRWEQINGKGSWEKNPWVWVYQFERIK